MRKSLYVVAVAISVSLVGGAFSARAGTDPGELEKAAKYCASVCGEWSVWGAAPQSAEMCLFGKASIGGVTLLNHKSQIAQKAVAKYFEPRVASPGAANIPNPASEFCQNAGGKVESVLDPASGGEIGLCKFDEDGSYMEEWTLFVGSEHENNKQLTEVLL